MLRMWMGISQNGTKLNMQQCLATSIITTNYILFVNTCLLTVAMQTPWPCGSLRALLVRIK